MIYVHQLTENEGDLFRVCGVAGTGSMSWFSAVGEYDHLNDELFQPDCKDPASKSDSLRITTLQEFGHNDLGVIEPDTDWCGSDEQHDNKADYVMAVEAERDDGTECGEHVNIEFHANRWDEYLTDIGSENTAPSEGGYKQRSSRKVIECREDSRIDRSRVAQETALSLSCLHRAQWDHNTAPTRASLRR